MIFLNITLEDFFIKYPTVKIMATEYSKAYRFKMNSLKPYMTKEFIGVYTELKDGRPVAISIRKCPEFFNQLEDLTLFDLERAAT